MTKTEMEEKKDGNLISNQLSTEREEIYSKMECSCHHVYCRGNC